jgi:cell division protein FtsW
MKFGGYDKILIIDIMFLLVFGLIVISSASVVLSYNKYGNNYYYLYHQFFYGIVPGLILTYVVSRFDYKKLKKYAPLFLIATLSLLLLVFIPGLTFGAKGASRWIVIAGQSFQPSEMAKLTFIIYLAAWLDQRKSKINDFNEGFMPFIMLIALVAIPIIKQPDIGTLISICLVAFAMYFMAGAGTKYMAIIFTGSVAAVMLLAKIEPYRMNRLKVFMHPELDPQGIGYQINQALLALGSGGIFGLGLGHSRQKFNYLPEPIGDSVFAITGEELGLIGLVFLISLYIIFAVRGFGIAENARDGFGKLLAVGITSWILFQVIMNIGAITSLIPLTGIPLPFVSYGGSSVISLLVGLGILLSVSRFGNTFKK